MKLKRYELIPTDSHKSFYGKAIVEVDKNGIETLYSYGTKIISKDVKGNLTRFYKGWTATTGRHIRSFCGLNKAEFLEMPVTGYGTYSDYLTPKQSLESMLARRYK